MPRDLTPDTPLTDEETARRRDELAKRMLNMPPQPLKPHSAMKLGKRKAKVSVKATKKPGK